MPGHKMCIIPPIPLVFPPPPPPPPPADPFFGAPLSPENHDSEGLVLWLSFLSDVRCTQRIVKF
jgi:hypothetical protein